MDRFTNDSDKAFVRQPSEDAEVVVTYADVAPGVQMLDTAVPVDHAGTTVYVKAWRYEESDRHPVVVVHDLGEQSDNYQATAQALVAKGFSVYLFDLRGHGRSGRRLAHAPSFNILVKDLLQVAAWVRHKEGSRAPVMLGQGVGALILMDFMKRYGAFCRAAILSAPCLELTSDVSVLRRLTLRFLAETMPTLRLPGALSPRFVKGTAQFPRLTAVFAHELLLAMKRAEARFIEYHGSVLILCPDKDSVCSYQQLKRYAAIHNEHNLKIADLQGTFHGVFTGDETARDAALKVVLPWLEHALQVPPEAAAAELRLSGASRVADEAEKPGATKA